MPNITFETEVLPVEFIPVMTQEYLEEGKTCTLSVVQVIHSYDNGYT